MKYITKLPKKVEGNKMSLASTLQKDGVRLTKEPYQSVRPSKMNHAPIEDIEELAYLIEHYKQLEPIIVYEDTTIDDGAKYTILSGERRYSAIKYNAENNRGDGIINMYVFPKPKDTWEEQRYIRIGNTYRTRTTDMIQKDVMECEENYEYLCSIDQKPAGLKRDWIGFECGISGRRADDYLKLRKQSVSTDAIASSENVEDMPKEKKEKQLNDAIKLFANGEKQIEKAMNLAEKLEETEAYHDFSYALSKVREILNKYSEKG
ncbi:MAG: ParB/Srx family N-terminal domain-containing protein [Bacilli bacterium]